MADYDIRPEEWQSTIDTVTTAKKDMDDSSDQMREIVKNSLVGAGITGEVAEQLAEAYDREVLSSARVFADSVQQQIDVNTKSLSDYSDMQDAASNIANR